MVAISVLLAATAATHGLAIAVPPRIGVPAIGVGTSSVHQVRNAHYVPHGPLAMARAYRKYGVPLPHDLKQAVSRLLSKRATGSEVASAEEYDVEYLTPVSIGTPPQVLNLDFDTGSSDLWVFSSETPKSQIQGQTVYDPAKSSTAKKVTGATWKISYGDGSGSNGDVYTDVVSVGGLSVPAQAVELAQKVSAQFTQDTNNDGLLGLGFSKINTVKPTKQNTFFDSAKSTLDQFVFTVDLKYREPGKYNFGYIDNTAYTGNISYSPADSGRGYWGWTANGYQIGSTAATTTKVPGIVDTGTTLLFLPQTIVNAYYKQVSGAAYDYQQGGVTFPCASKLPSLSFGTGGTNAITIPGSYINFAPLDKGSPTCFGGLQDDSQIGLSIFGDVALKAGFVVFDGEKSQIGWASKKLSS